MGTQMDYRRQYKTLPRTPSTRGPGNPVFPQAHIGIVSYGQEYSDVAAPLSRTEVKSLRIFFLYYSNARARAILTRFKSSVDIFVFLESCHRPSTVRRSSRNIDTTPTISHFAQHGLSAGKKG